MAAKDQEPKKKEETVAHTDLDALRTLVAGKVNGKKKTEHAILLEMDSVFLAGRLCRV